MAKSIERIHRIVKEHDDEYGDQFAEVKIHSNFYVEHINNNRIDHQGKACDGDKFDKLRADIGVHRLKCP
jgi:cell fate (sporulation/competence/biofilm development) regulator YmcA (YheA/YmcA/DUF963 family)